VKIPQRNATQQIVPQRTADICRYRQKTPQGPQRKAMQVPLQRSASGCKQIGLETSSVFKFTARTAEANWSNNDVENLVTGV